MSNTTLAEHLTFYQQVERGDTNPEVCACWLAGHGDIRGLRKEQVQHPSEFGFGWLVAFEAEQDI
jgi:hypothetical protein